MTKQLDTFSKAGMFPLLVLFALLSCPATFRAQEKTSAEKDATMQVYPNPTAGKINVVIKAREQFFHVNIYNVVGEMIYHWESGKSSSADFEVDLSKSPEGIYFVELDTREANVLKRIILERNN